MAKRGQHVAWKDLSSEQMKEVLVMYPLSSRDGGFRHEWWAYLIMPDGHLTKAKGLHKMTEAGEKAYRSELLGEGNASFCRPEKGDLSAWKPGTTFHVSRG